VFKLKRIKLFQLIEKKISSQFIHFEYYFGLTPFETLWGRGTLLKKVSVKDNTKIYDGGNK